MGAYVCAVHGLVEEVDQHIRCRPEAEWVRTIDATGLADPAQAAAFAAGVAAAKAAMRDVLEAKKAKAMQHMVTGRAPGRETWLFTAGVCDGLIETVEGLDVDGGRA